MSSGQTLGVKAQRFRGHTSPHRNVKEKKNNGFVNVFWRIKQKCGKKVSNGYFFFMYKCVFEYIFAYCTGSGKRRKYQPQSPNILSINPSPLIFQLYHFYALSYNSKKNQDCIIFFQLKHRNVLMNELQINFMCRHYLYQYAVRLQADQVYGYWPSKKYSQVVCLLFICSLYVAFEFGGNMVCGV
eukprot:TRINITY_DN12272_c0_g2_i7.p1 TRINITY_DN12272_c0_g2~~TRINITY_DN12272_c0_g2_i7.p1  ORF type:complete len:185 (-),score=6.71 TRINITY_DN12272_c0_g2_i7:108-662(-)